MRSMVEGPSGAVRPSTALRAVPLPMSFAHREDWSARHMRFPSPVGEGGIMTAFSRRASQKDVSSTPTPAQSG